MVSGSVLTAILKVKELARARCSGLGIMSSTTVSSSLSSQSKVGERVSS